MSTSIGEGIKYAGISLGIALGVWGAGPALEAFGNAIASEVNAHTMEDVIESCLKNPGAEIGDARSEFCLEAVKTLIK